MTSWLSRRTKRRVVVQTKDGNSIDGLLWKTARDGIVLFDARYVGDSSPVPLDGLTYVPKANVSFLQVVVPEIRGASKP